MCIHLSVFKAYVEYEASSGRFDNRDYNFAALLEDAHQGVSDSEDTRRVITSDEQQPSVRAFAGVGAETGGDNSAQAAAGQLTTSPHVGNQSEVCNAYTLI